MVSGAVHGTRKCRTLNNLPSNNQHASDLRRVPKSLPSAASEPARRLFNVTCISADHGSRPRAEIPVRDADAGGASTVNDANP